MDNPASLQGKSIHIVNGDASARKAYQEAFIPFLKAGATIQFHDSPNAFLNAVRPGGQPDVLITAPFFKDDFDGVGFLSKLHSEGYDGSTFVGSGFAHKILDGMGDLRRLVRSVLTGSPYECPSDSSGISRAA